jgi:hypothetical protein
LPDCWSNYNLGLTFIEKNSTIAIAVIKIATPIDTIIPMMSVLTSGFAITIGIDGTFVLVLVLFGIIVIEELFWGLVLLDGGTGGGTTAGGGGGETGRTGF